MSIVLDRLVKHYDGHLVVSEVSLEIADGEFFVLLGPSGSGKSTILRMIAGLTSVDSGRVLLHGRDVTAEPPQRRGVGFVFQHYALFRNMTVTRNIEFALRVRRVAEVERRRRCQELLNMVGLAGLGDRYPQQLSGGQQQRVALARALAHDPAVLLLDEPFGALDAVIRSDLRRSVRRVQRELGITTIFVTHDQDEAFELADRVGVMNDGRLLEVAAPADLYASPKTAFAATFIGTANLMVGHATERGVRVGPVDFPLDEDDPEESMTGRVQVLFRPEDVKLSESAESVRLPLLGEAVVEEMTFSGSYERLRLRLASLTGVRAIAPSVSFGGGLIVDALRPQHVARVYPLRVGDKTWVGVRRIHRLAHRGLSILLFSDGSAAAQAATRLGAEIGRCAQARVTLLACGAPEAKLRDEVQAAQGRFGREIAEFDARIVLTDAGGAVAKESARQPYDLVVVPRPPHGDADAADYMLRAGTHNVLLVPSEAALPKRVLICVAIGEPGKSDVQFAARLVRHLAAEATILTVLADGHTANESAEAQRFLDAGSRAMTLLGVPVRTRLRSGSALREILDELTTENHDLLVVGAPLPDRAGRVKIGGLVADLIMQSAERPVLVVRAPEY